MCLQNQITDSRSQQCGTVIEPGKRKEIYEKGHDRDDKIDSAFGSYSEPPLAAQWLNYPDPPGTSNDSLFPD